MAISNISNRLRLSGLSSGLDTEALVSSMMKLEQRKYDSQWKIKAKMEFRQEALTKLQNTVRDFRNEFFSQASKNSSMISRLTFTNYTVQSDDKNDVVAIKATGSTYGNIEISKITQLAKGATATSSAQVSKLIEPDSSKRATIQLTDKLKNVMTENGLEFNEFGKISFYINGEVFEFDKDDTLQKVINTVNSNSRAGVTMSYSAATDKLSIVGKQTGYDAKMFLAEVGDGNFFKAFNVRTGQFSGQNAEMILNGTTVPAAAAQAQSTAKTFDGMGGIAVVMDSTLDQLGMTSVGGYVTFKINGKDFSFADTEKLSDVINAVNADPTAGVRIGVSDTNTEGIRFVITDKGAAGPDSKMVLSDENGTDFFAMLNIGTERAYMGHSEFMEGTYVSTSSNNFTLDGVEYSLKKTTDTPITFSSKLNTDAIVDSIKAFVDGYNKLYQSITDKLSEKVYRDFSPLTSDERSSLKDSEAALWDEKAKSGLLRNDRDLKALLSDMRMSLYEKVGGTGKMMADIGITTSNYFQGADSSTLGMIMIDEEKLRAAIEADPQGVADMFTKTSSAADSKVKSEETGYAQKLYNIMNTYTNTTYRDTYTRLNDDIYKMEKRLDELQTKLYKKEEALYARFTAMETALSKLNSQSDWISSQLASIGK